MSRIFLINQYASTPDTGGGGRNHYLARELAQLGHDVTLFAGSYHHLLRDPKARTLSKESVESYTFRRIQVPKYKHAHDKRRILAWFVFTWKIMRIDFHKIGKPEVILYSSPSLFGFMGARYLAKKTRARLIFEVRDMWPQTLINIGGYSPRHPMIRLMQHIEEYAYSVADGVVSNAEGAVVHMKQHGLDPEKFTWIPNGILEFEAQQKLPIPSDVDVQFPREKFIVGYAGTLGSANAMDILIEAAKILSQETNIEFVIVGEGRDKSNLQQLVKKYNLHNVTFLSAVSKMQVQTVLSRFDVCYIGWKKSPLYKVGVAANKIFDYLYSSKPILHSYSGGYDPIERYGAGVSIEAENAEKLAIAITMMRDMPQEKRDRMGENGRKACLKHHEYKQLAKKLEAVLLPGKASQFQKADNSMVPD